MNPLKDVKLSKANWIRQRVYISDFFEMMEPPSLAQSLATATVADLLLQFRCNRVSRAQYAAILRRRRCLFRGLMKGNPDAVIGFHFAKSDNSRSLLTTQYERVHKKAASLDRQQKRAAPLSGLIFDIKDATMPLPAQHRSDDAVPDRTLRDVATAFSQCGAIHWGDTVAPAPPVFPSTNLPHPFHKDIQVGGSSGGGALSVALGLSTFSLGTNGGGSNRIPAGLLGLCGMYFGEGFTKSASVGTCGKMFPACCGVIARTPQCAAILCGALNGSESMTLNDVNAFLRRTDSEPARIGWLIDFDSHQIARNTFPTVAGERPHQALDVSSHVRDNFMSVINSMSGPDTRAHFSLRDASRSIADPSEMFWLSWMQRVNEVWDDPYGLRSNDVKSLMLDPVAKFMKTDEATYKNLSKLAGEDAHKFAAECADKLESVDFLLTPLLRVPYWRVNELPSRPSLYGQVLDPSFNPYCILANLWRSPSVTIPLALRAPHPVRSQDECHLPYALLLTATPKRNRPLPTTTQMQLLKIANHIHEALWQLEPPPFFNKECWHDANVNDPLSNRVRATNFPPSEFVQYQ